MLTKIVSRSCARILFSFAGQSQPDVNLTVQPSLTIPPLSDYSIICDASEPRFPVSTTANLQPVKITIYVGRFEVKTCAGVNVAQCVYNDPTYFPTSPQTISCTAANAQNECRFKVTNIQFQGWLIVVFK